MRLAIVAALIYEIVKAGYKLSVTSDIASFSLDPSDKMENQTYVLDDESASEPVTPDAVAEG